MTKHSEQSQSGKEETSSSQSGGSHVETPSNPEDIFANLEETLEQVAESNPRIKEEESESLKQHDDLRALLEASLAVNSSLVLDDLLQLVMHKAIELMQAERGLIMLLDENNELQLKSAYNLSREELKEEDFKVSNSVTSQVAKTKKPVYTSDALADDRYSQQKSVVELHLRSIMCVPIVVKEKAIGVIYLDNSSQSKMFLKSDLYLFELYAQLVSNALHNAKIYESLLRTERYSHSVVSGSPVGLIVLDTSGEIATMNIAALEIFDFNKENIHTFSDMQEPSVFLDLLPEKQQKHWGNMINTSLTTNDVYSDPRFYHETGYLEKVLSIKISPIAGLPNRRDGVIMAVEDVTEKITMEQYVIISEKLVARGEMAASVAHELNNYLSIISNNAELMSMNIEKGKFDKVKFNSRSISDSVFKIKRFVDSLMDFSKPESEYIAYDLRSLVDDVLFSLRIQPRFKLINFTTDLGHEMPKIEIDVGQIQQVLMNLLINAADAIGERAAFMEEKGEQYNREISIQIIYDKKTEFSRIKIADNGMGMSPETLSKIFNLHFTTKKGGHGLGLHNCRKIVQIHGGEIDVISKENEGTTFSIALPSVQVKVIHSDPEKK